MAIFNTQFAAFSPPIFFSLLTAFEKMAQNNKKLLVILGATGAQVLPAADSMPARLRLDGLATNRMQRRGSPRAREYAAPLCST